MNKQIDDMLQKRMDRKDFLKHVGMGVAIITGTAGVVRLLQPQKQVAQKAAASQQVAAYGYGASVYGGRPSGKL